MSKSNRPESSKKLVQRREFLGGAATVAGASLMGRAAGSPWLGLPPVTAADPGPTPEMPAATQRKMKRWQEQRWLLDAIVQTVGMEWDQARVAYTLGPCGPDATPDFNGVRARVENSMTLLGNTLVPRCAVKKWRASLKPISIPWRRAKATSSQHCSMAAPSGRYTKTLGKILP